MVAANNNDYYYTTKTVRIYPTDAQKLHLAEINNHERFFYNGTVELKLKYPEMSKYDLTGWFTNYKHTHTEVNSITAFVYGQHAIWKGYEACELAQAAKGDATVSYRRRKDNRLTIGSYMPPGRIVDDTTICLVGLGKMKTSGNLSKFCHNHHPRSFEITTREQRRGKLVYYLHLSIRRLVKPRQAKSTPSSPSLVMGIDIGVKQPVTVSVLDEKHIQKQYWVSKTEDFDRLASKISKMQSDLSGKQPGSNRHKALAEKLQTCRDRLTNLQTHAERILAKDLVNEDTREIVMEKLNVRGLTAHNGNKKRKFNRKFRLVRPYMLKQAIKRRCDKFGVKFTEIDPKYTSQMCCVCSHTVKENRHGSLFKCMNCGHVENADSQAATNIALVGSSYLKGYKRAISESYVHPLERRQMDTSGRFFRPFLLPGNEETRPKSLYSIFQLVPKYESWINPLKRL